MLLTNWYDSQCFFFPVTRKVTRDTHFWTLCHGCHGQLFCVLSRGRMIILAVSRGRILIKLGVKLRCCVTGVTGYIFSTCHGQEKVSRVTFFERCHGLKFACHGKTKTLLAMGSFYPWESTFCFQHLPYYAD